MRPARGRKQPDPRLLASKRFRRPGPRYSKRFQVWVLKMMNTKRPGGVSAVENPLMTKGSG